MAAILTEAPRQGWKVGPLIAIGHTALELILVILISLGLSSALNHPLIRDVIAVAGGIMLFYIGGSYLVGVWRQQLNLPRPDTGLPQRSPPSLVLLGVGTTVSNPFWYTWWVTVAAGYLAQARQLSLLAVGLFYIGHISADFAWDTALGLASSSGKRFLTVARYRGLIVLTGLFMLYLGTRYLLSVVQG